MNFLRDKLADLFESERGAAGLFNDVWNARDKYIDVILDRSIENVNKFLNENANHELNDEEKVRALSLMEMQRNSLLMFTSCGWFFDEISRIEPVQIMRYAARAIDLAKMLFNEDLEPAYLKLLAEAPSNVPELQDGAKIYELRAKQGRADRLQIAAYYGIASLLNDFTQSFSEGCWDMHGDALKLGDNDSISFSAGKVHVRSSITLEEGDYIFAVNHIGGTSIACGIAEDDDPDNALTFDEVKSLQALFNDDNKEALLFGRFGYNQFTLTNIPSDAWHRIISELLRQDVDKLEASMKGIVQNYDNLLEYLTLLNAKPPAIMITAAEFTLTSEIIRRLENGYHDVNGIRRAFDFAAFWQVKPDEERIRFAFSDCINEILAELCMRGLNLESLEDLNELIKLFSEKFEWHLSLYESQNLYYELLKKNGPNLKYEPERVSNALHELGRSLRFSDEILNKMSR